MRVFRTWLIVFLAAVVLVGCAALQRPSERGLADDIRTEGVHNYDAVRQFYDLNGGQPVWTGEANANNLSQLVKAVRDSESHGLTPEHYHLAMLRRVRGRDPDLSADWFITDVYMTLAAHLAHGKVDPNRIESTWNFRPDGLDAPAYLQAALDTGQVRESLEALAPQHAEYQRLREGLALYRRIELDGGWPEISAGATLHPGDRSARVAELRARLEATGDLPPVEEGREVFSPALERAVVRFQRRAGIEADGVVGPQTLEHLNRSAADRVRQLRVTLDRWRWLPRDLGQRHLRVNIAGFQLEAWEEGERVRVHDAIVGRTYRRTPVFSSSMRYLVLNPWWEVPASIAVQDKLPQFRRDPAVIQEMGYEIRGSGDRVVDPATIDWSSVSSANFPYRIRQRPGPQNALGRIKFMFPNVHNVYIHDTPSRELFDGGQRTFSSGCIRIAQPLELAGWILAGRAEWPAETVRNTVDSGVETRIDLNSPIPVHILYFTVVVDEDVGFRFLNDVYDRDGGVLRALDVAPGAGEDEA